MKFLIVLLLSFTTSAFAQNICDYSETHEFIETLETFNISTDKVSKNHKRFTFVEKAMIHLTVTRQGWLAGLSREEALSEFADMYEGKIGGNAGEISYYSYGGKNYALVHYWPGDNEVGAYFELTGKAFKLIAEISDSFIECRSL